MLTTIKGIYDHGQITLEETPQNIERAEVIVTFTEREKSSQRKDRTFGSGKGLITYMAPDFNEPLDDLKE